MTNPLWRNNLLLVVSKGSYGLERRSNANDMLDTVHSGCSTTFLALARFTFYQYRAEGARFRV